MSRVETKPAQAEMLEVRQLLAASVTLNPSGYLQIMGTDRHDNVFIMSSETGIIRVHVNEFTDSGTGATDVVDHYFALSTFPHSVVLYGSSGNDSLHNWLDEQFIVHCTMYGEDGNDNLSGGPGIDIFHGGNGDDSFSGAAGPDKAFGGEGNDTLSGDGGNDSLQGENGDDSINGDGGTDTLSGGAGTDLLNGGSGNDLISELFSSQTQYVLAQNSATSTDSVKNFEAASITDSGSADRIDLSGFTFPSTISGGDDFDTLIGGSNADYISGGSGYDSLIGGAGNDTLAGGPDVDWMTGGAGDDVFNGGTSYGDVVVELADANMVLTDNSLTGVGTDSLISIEYARLVGGAGNNTIDASAFTRNYDSTKNVTLEGGAGDDLLIGTKYADILTGGLGNDTVNGGDGNDAMQEWGDDLALSDTQLHEFGAVNYVNSYTSISFVQLFGSAANSRLDASATVNCSVTLSGNDGDDTLIGPSRNVYLSGGSGTDRAVMNVSGILEIRSTPYGYYTFGNSGKINSVERLELSGDSGPDKIDATQFIGSVLLRGVGGNDTLFGGVGNDTLAGGEGDDSLNGGLGTDRALAQADADLIATNGQITGEGTDSLTGIEQLELTGGGGKNRVDASGFTLGPADLRGEMGNDTLLGTAFNDTLNGGDGIDRLKAASLGGYNYYLTNTALMKRQGNQAVDQLQSIERASLSLANGTGRELDASGFTLGPVTLIGGNGNDSLIGSSRGDSLDGGDGIDWIRSGGNFNFVVTDTSMTGRGNDVLTSIEALQLMGGDAANHRFDATGFHGTIFLLGAGGNDTILGGCGRDSLYGSTGDDVLDGGSGDDEFEAGYGGGPGHDTMIGGDGNDVFYAGPGNDVYQGGAGDDVLQQPYSSGDSDSFDGGIGHDTLLFSVPLSGLVTVTDSLVSAWRPTALAAVEVVKVRQFSGTLDASAATLSVFVNGSSGNDTINGLAGDDSLIGGGGNDSLNGGTENDVLTGGEGNSKLIGGEGDDFLTAGDGNDKLDGGLGFDTFDSGLGTDTVLGHEVGE